MIYDVKEFCEALEEAVKQGKINQLRELYPSGSIECIWDVTDLNLLSNTRKYIAQQYFDVVPFDEEFNIYTSGSKFMIVKVQIDDVLNVFFESGGKLEKIRVKALTRIRNANKQDMQKLRKSALKHPLWATNYARFVEKQSHIDTRTAACNTEGQYECWHYPIMYATLVDNHPHNMTRTACCKQKGGAYEYALKVDKGPHPETRIACGSNHPDSMLRYVKNVEQKYYPETHDILKEMASRSQEQWEEVLQEKRHLASTYKYNATRALHEYERLYRVY